MKRVFSVFVCLQDSYNMIRPLKRVMSWTMSACLAAIRYGAAFRRCCSVSGAEAIS